MRASVYSRVAALLLAVLTVGGLAIPSVARAAPVAVANAGFEDLYLGSNLPAQYGGDVPTGAFPTGPPPAGWTRYDQGGTPVAGSLLGVLNPGTSADHAPDPPCFPAGAPEGDNVVLLFTGGAAGGDEYGVSQVLSETLAAHTIYTLTVEVGNIASCAGLVAPYLSFFTLDGFPGYRVQLLAGGEVIAEDSNTLSIPEGEFRTARLQLTTDASPAQLGGALEIRLVNRNEPDVPGVGGLEVDFDDVRLDVTPVPPVPLPTVALCVLGLALLVRCLRAC